VSTVRDAHDVDHGAWLSQGWRKVNGYAGIDRIDDVRFGCIASSIRDFLLAVDA
jgi:hypothetical protein